MIDKAKLMTRTVNLEIVADCHDYPTVYLNVAFTLDEFGITDTDVRFNGNELREAVVDAVAKCITVERKEAAAV